MSKADTLLKKATAFERLALYSDRKSFLQSLAQSTTGLDQTSRDLLGKAMQVMQQIGISQETIAPLGSAILFNKVDPQAIRQAFQKAQFEVPALSTGPQLAFLKSILSQIKFPSSGSLEQSPTTDVGVGAAPGKAEYPSIDKQSQKAVFDFAVQEGGIVPDPEKQQADGALGPETRKALEAVKNYFAKAHPQNPRMTDQQAIRAATFKGRQ